MNSKSGDAKLLSHGIHNTRMTIEMESNYQTKIITIIKPYN